ncbi:MAG: hypothetical protein IPJ90_16730 [Anaerolineaceae bacterium]|nr:hypothetical protein [Anaerolineaceae bacterium]
MQEEIDLRPYIQNLLRNAKWIIGTSIILAVATFFILYSRPKIYTASASVLVIGDSNVFNFDPRIQSIIDNAPKNVIPELAMSNDILLELVEDNTLTSNNIQTIEDLTEILEATSRNDRSLIRLSATTTDPAISADIANRWAEIFIDRTNSIYGKQNENTVGFFQEQLSLAETTLATAESNLIQFQEINRTALISNTISFYNEEQTRLLTNQQTINQLLHDSQTMQNQISNLPDDTVTTLADQITALNMQLEAYGNNNEQMPLQIDSTTILVGNTKGEQTAFLQRLNEYLQTKLFIIEERLKSLEPEVLVLQQSLQEAIIENQRLERSRLIAEETFISSARKAQEEQILAQDDESGLRIISQATIPVKPESTRALQLTALAGVATFSLTTLFFIIYTWWKQETVA